MIHICFFFSEPSVLSRFFDRWVKDWWRLNRVKELVVITSHTTSLLLLASHFHFSLHSSLFTSLFTFHFSLLILLLFTSLLTPHSSLLTIHFSLLFTSHSSFSLPHFSLFTIHSSLFTSHFSIHSSYSSSSLLTLHSSLLTLHCSCYFSLFLLLFTKTKPSIKLFSVLLKQVYENTITVTRV
jgi:hypothetical protein